MLVQLLLGLGAAYLIWSLVAMEINYRRASSMGIPLVRLPIDPMNIPWVVLEPSLWRLLDRLPFSWGTFGHYSRRGWHFHDKAESHLHYGLAWALVTPRDVYVYVADLGAIHDIFVRRGDFLRPSKMYSKCFASSGSGIDLNEPQSCWKSMGHVSLPRVGQIGNAIGKSSQRPSMRTS
jgi:hypothetical protein